MGFDNENQVAACTVYSSDISAQLDAGTKLKTIFKDVENEAPPTGKKWVVTVRVTVRETEA